MNLHLQIEFENGDKWLARIIRRNYTSFSNDLTNTILKSEYATLRWLESVNIPASRVFAYGLQGDPENVVGAAFLLVTEVPGTPYLTLDPTAEQQTKVFGQLASYFKILKGHPFPKVGSLYMPDEHELAHVGPIASDRTGTLLPIGPFNSAPEYYTVWCEAYLNLISTRQILTSFSVDVYLMFRYMKDLATLGKLSLSTSLYDDGPFYLKHMDDKGDHILVDGHFNITGFIDWTFARIVPFYEAFGPSLFAASMDDIYAGIVRMGERDILFAQEMKTIDQDMASLWEGEDKVRRFLLALGTGLEPSWEQVLDLFKAVLKVAGEDLVNFDWHRWKGKHLAAYLDDPSLQPLIDLNK